MRPADDLRHAVRSLMGEALYLYQDSPRASTWLRDHLDRFDEPLRVAVTGRAGAGKSALINVLVGAEAAPIGAGLAGQPLTRYQDGPAPRITVYSTVGPAYELPVARLGDGLRLDPAAPPPPDASELVVELPVRALRHWQLVDTPAIQIGAGGDGAPGATLARRVLRDADVVLYLTRHVDDADLRFLRMARQGTVAAATPVNVLTVLSRADEIAGGGIGALTEAKQLARRHRRDPVFGPMSQHVVALAPRLARAATTLTDPEFAALATIAGVPRTDLDAVLLSADRFTGHYPASNAVFPAPADAATRRVLLDRLGLFGVRLCTTLVRTGCRTREQLSAELVRRSGLAELRESVRELFLDRRDALKARSALIALEFMVRTEPTPGAEHLLAGLERTVAGTHDFQELRLLAALRAGRVRMPAPLVAEARRLAGAAGTSIVARLGLEHDPTEDELWTLSNEALRRWRLAAEDVALTAEQHRAATVVVRSCEGIVARVGAAGVAA
ncbi:50S ribosome-binding GTPase [Dactylosporangium sp. NBC_01737]|uniref:GTP-binding protein n=1 Tax=Dactylosporangium sp. NBC_01737 TaxID=2975959 RepID=UPI002E136859|nr:50S ribosome-binding GTPase [Dactylosporangium sp. NBC_01737]